MSSIPDQLAALSVRFEAAVAAAADERALEEVRVSFLGRSGDVTAIRRGIGALAPAERPAAGKVINEAVELLEARLESARAQLENRALAASLGARIDVTFPAIRPRLGSIHPLRRTMEDIVGYFQRRGFAVVLGPEIDSDHYNFDAINIPPDHPARENLDSFYLRPHVLLRAHTSTMQVRTMEKVRPPLAIVAPGKAYRRDAVDARHTYMFHQIEGLCVGEDIHFGHLKAMLTGMCRELFGPGQSVRFRPSFFPFTEPSAEVDTTCPGCAGRGCRTCGGSGWLELGGSGMVHPNVLRGVDYDPEVYSGWAFGIGIERIAMVRYDIGDIRTFFENDLQFLEQLS